MDNLQALLNRVKAATGPDPDLDAWLWLACGIDHVDWNVSAKGRFNHLPAGRHDLVNGQKLEDALKQGLYGIASAWNVPRLTASVDAALEAVERMLPGWGWTVDGGGSPSVTILDWNGGGPRMDREYRSVGATPPIAILAALLSAMIAKESA